MNSSIIWNDFASPSLNPQQKTLFENIQFLLSSSSTIPPLLVVIPLKIYMFLSSLTKKNVNQVGHPSSNI